MSFSATWTSQIPAIAAEAKSRAGKVVAKTARDIEAGAKMRAAVRTGNLRGSIQAIQAASFNWRVNVGAHYGVYVEFGTSKMAAQPYLIPAAEAAIPAFRAAMARIVG